MSELDSVYSGLKIPDNSWIHLPLSENCQHLSGSREPNTSEFDNHGRVEPLFHVHVV